MMFRSKIFAFQTILLCSLVTASFAGVTISGPSSTCIGNSLLEFTAEATLLGGPQKGDFRWSIWRDGVMIFSDGNNFCDPGVNSTSNVTKTLSVGSDPGMVSIRVKFVPYNVPGCDAWEDWHDVTIIAEPVGPISGALFCGPNQTRTLSIPTPGPSNCIPAEFVWSVPSGWAVVPANGASYTVVSNGIITTATVVNVTSSSTALATGYTGNYNVTVRRGPYSFYTESTVKIWVGTPGFPTAINGPSQLSVDASGLYKVTSVVAADSYSWTVDSPWYIYTSGPIAGGSAATVVARSQALVYLRAYANNICGTSSTFKSILGTAPCSSSMAVASLAPNPTTRGKAIVSIAPPPPGCEAQIVSSPVSEEGTIVVMDSFGQKVVERSYTGTQIEIDGLRPGVYYVNINHGGEQLKPLRLITK